MVIMNMKVKDLKKGDYFTMKPLEKPKENQVYIRGDYDRSSKKYSCEKFSDTCSERFFDGNKEVPWVLDSKLICVKAAKVTYENGVVIYINRGSKDVSVDGITVPAQWYTKKAGV